MTKDKVPVLYLEVFEQGDSGFYLDGTRGTQYEQQLHAPTVSWIPTEGISVEVDDKGVRRNKRIRHIKGCEILDPIEQEKNGWKPNRNNDKIPLDNGFISVPREGATIGTYDYLKQATYFFDNPLRPDSATPIYREVKIDERAVELVDEDELVTVAKSKIYALRLTTGNKENPYNYNEDKINAYCQLLNIWEETPQRKVFLLLEKAKSDPRSFLNIITKAEQTVITEISHALQLNVIKFEGNTAQYNKENKVIATLGTAKMSNDKKVEALASFLQTPEGNGALTELRTNLEIEKENQFSAK